MIKNGIVYCILFSVSVYSVSSQNWAPVGSGITGTDVNTTWALCAYDSLLYAGGWFNSAGGTEANNIAQWNGGIWDSIGRGCDGHVNAIVVYNGNLYVGGQFNFVGGIAAKNIAEWNGSGWMPVGAGISGGQYGVCSMAVYNGVLYAGGSFDSAGGIPAYAIARWNDTSWLALGTSEISAADEDDGVFALAVYNGELYLAGDFVTTGGTNIAKWNGSDISVVGLGTTGPVYSLAVYDGNLYVGGMMTMAGIIPVKSIVRWNNITWSTVDSGIWGENGYASVSAMTVYDGELYAGGFFDTVNGKSINCIAKWNGMTWSAVSSGINVGGSIDAMAIVNNSLYVGGGFDSAGGVYAKNIARWTVPTSINEIGDNNKIYVYPNPANTLLSVTTSYFNNDMLYTIYNEVGQQVGTGRMDSLNNTIINVSSYKSGVYLLSVSDGNIKYNIKFIKN